jgi:hypothetical protein
VLTETTQSPSAPINLLFRIGEVCEALGIGRTKPYEEHAAGRLLTVRAAGRTLVHWVDLAAYADARRAEAVESRRTIH